MSRVAAAVILALLVLFPLCGAVRVESRDERFEAAVRTLSRATQPRAGGEHIRLLSGLRQMEDPALAPLFERLTFSTNAAIQVAALLGAAEVAPQRRIDLAAWARLREAQFRALALVQAFDRDLIDADGLRTLLARTDLAEDLHVYLLVMLASMGEEPDVATLQSLAASARMPGTRGYAALALMHLGRPDAAAEGFAEIDRLPRAARESAIIEICGTLERLNLTGSATWLRSVTDDEAMGPRAVTAALRALLALDPGAAQPAWRHHFHNADGLAQRVRLAVLLLQFADVVEPALFEELRTEGLDLFADIATAGAAIASGSPALEECRTLIERHHVPTTVAVLRHAQRLTGEHRTDLLAAFVENTLRPGAALNDRLEIARQASEHLLTHAPQRLESLMITAREAQHRLTVEAILSGALGANDPSALRLVEDVDERTDFGAPGASGGWPSSRAQSLAAIVRARYADDLTDDDLYRLTLIFRGAGSVPLPAEAQAAWLYLKRTGEQDRSLEMVLKSLP